MTSICSWHLAVFCSRGAAGGKISIFEGTHTQTRLNITFSMRNCLSNDVYVGGKMTEKYGSPIIFKPQGKKGGGQREPVQKCFGAQ